MQDEFCEVLSFLSPRLAVPLSEAISENFCAEEIRLRENAPLLLKCGGALIPLNTVTETGEVDAVFKKMIHLSVYSYSGELKNGFFTLPSGQRVGVCLSGGKAQSLCIRIPKEINGVADKLLRVYKGGGVLAAGPPASGKTTFIRDFADALSSGRFAFPRSVAVVDSRGEISLCGKSPLCKKADVILFKPKSEGISQAIRTLAPETVIFDEIADSELSAVEEGLFSGVDIVTSAHIGNKDDLLKRAVTRKLLDSGAINYVVLFGNNHEYSVFGVAF